MFTVQLGNGTSPQAHSWEVVLIGSESGCVASQPCSSQHSLFSDKPLVNLSNDKWYFWHAEVGHHRGCNHGAFGAGTLGERGGFGLGLGCGVHLSLGKGFKGLGRSGLRRDIVPARVAGARLERVEEEVNCCLKHAPVPSLCLVQMAT